MKVNTDSTAAFPRKLLTPEQSEAMTKCNQNYVSTMAELLGEKVDIVSLVRIEYEKTYGLVMITEVTDFHMLLDMLGKSFDNTAALCASEMPDKNDTVN